MTFDCPFNLWLPATREWLGRLEQDEPVALSSREIVEAIHDGRIERVAQIGWAIADRD
jgi:hypothetical protein